MEEEEEVVWKVLDVASEADITPSIKEWYDNPTEADTARLDIPCVSFDDHVHCIAFAEDDVMEMDVSALHPVNDALFIFYVFREAIGKVYILGALTYESLVFRDNGVVDRNRLEKTRLFISLFNNDDGGGGGEEKEVFWLPMVLPGGDVECTMEQVRERMEMYRNGGGGGIVDPSDGEPALYLFTRLLLDHIEFGYSIPNTSMDARRLAFRYAVMRISAEARLFFHRMSGRSESNLIDLLKWNGWTQEAFEGIVVDGTVLDFKWFSKMYPRAKYCPTVFFNVWIEDVPVDLAVSMPKYGGGKVHLPCYWECVALWVWNLFIVEEHKHLVKPNRHLVPREGPIYHMLHDEAITMRRYMITTRPVTVMHEDKQNTSTAIARAVNVGRSIRSKLTDAELQAGVDIVDIEDIWRASPPCITALRDAGRFPRHYERMRFVQTMREAQINTSSMTRLLTLMNDNYPRDGKHQPLQSRFALEYSVKSNMGVHWCMNVITDTLAHHSDTIQCPFVATIDGAHRMDKEQLRVQCCVKCSGRPYLKSPHKVMESRLLEMGYLKVGPDGRKLIPQAQPLQAVGPVITPAPEEEEDEEEGDEEEEKRRRGLMAMDLSE